MNKPQATPQKEDKGLFLQLPFVFIDTFDMSDSATIGFIRLCRECLQKDKTIRYSGSYRALAKTIKQARGTCYRSVEAWIKAGLVSRQDNADEFVLTGNLSSLWSQNAEYCKALQRPKFDHQQSSTASQICTTSVPNLTTSVPILNNGVPNLADSVPILTTSEHENAPIDSIDSIDSNRDTIDTKREKGIISSELSHPESPTLLGFATATPTAPSPVVEVSHSQEKQPISQEKIASKKKEKPIQATLPVDLGPLAMPDTSAPWNAGTAVLVSEVLRDKRYTPMQRGNQENTAKRMLRDFPSMTRSQFEEIFTDWAKWWHDHDKGFFTLADLLVKGKNNEIRLQSALDRLEAQKNKPATKTPPASQPQQHVRASSPNTAGYQPLTEEERKRNFERALAKRDAMRAAAAAQAAI